MSNPARFSISVVTPTLHRPAEVAELLHTLSDQTLLPFELVLVDGAPESRETEEIIEGRRASLAFECQYIRHGGGTAIQRNVGIDAASGDYIAFIDDDIRLEPDFFEVIASVFASDIESRVGGITGYITNQFLDAETSPRWRWYRRLKLFTTYEPGRYDYQTGYPINRYTQPPHEGVREIDFMGSGCVVWRREVFDRGLRFSEFFAGFGVLEDAHLALRASRDWKLQECGRARCVHLRASGSRENARSVSRKTAVNYRFVFIDLVPDRSLRQEYRFWRVQVFDLLRFILYAVRHPGIEAWETVIGKFMGIISASRLKIDRFE